MANVDNSFKNIASKGSVNTRLTNVTCLGRGKTLLTDKECVGYVRNCRMMQEQEWKSQCY